MLLLLLWLLLLLLLLAVLLVVLRVGIEALRLLLLRWLLLLLRLLLLLLLRWPLLLLLLGGSFRVGVDSAGVAGKGVGRRLEAHGDGSLAVGHAQLPLEVSGEAVRAVVIRREGKRLNVLPLEVLDGRGRRRLLPVGRLGKGVLR